MKLHEIVRPPSKPQKIVPVEWRGIKFDGSEESYKTLAELRTLRAIFSNYLLNPKYFSDHIWLDLKLGKSSTDQEEKKALIKQWVHNWFGTKTGKAFQEALEKLVSVFEKGNTVDKKSVDWGWPDIRTTITNDLKLIENTVKQDSREFNQIVNGQTESWDLFIKNGSFTALSEKGKDMQRSMTPREFDTYMSVHTETVQFMVEHEFAERTIKNYVQGVVNIFGKHEFLPEISAILYGNTKLLAEDFQEPNEPKFKKVLA